MDKRLDQSQVADLARPILNMVDTILDYYKDAAHEKAFHEWYQQKYGQKAPEGV